MNPTVKIECPACRKRIKTPLAMSGAKTNCPNCGQRMQVPDLKNKTVLATMAEAVTAEPPPIVTLACPPRSYRFAWLALLLLGVSTFIGTVFLVRFLFFPPHGTVAEQRSLPRTPEETAVKAFVLAREPPPVAFSTWGPHMTSAKFRSLFIEAMGEPGVAAVERKFGRNWFEVTLCRVVYRVKEEPKERDEVFMVKADGTVEPSGLKGGDDWMPQARGLLAQWVPTMKQRP